MLRTMPSISPPDHRVPATGRILDFLDAVARASALESVWELHCAAMASFGFDRLIYGYTRFGTKQSLGRFEDALFLTNHDGAYIEGFLRSKMFLSSPVLRWGRSHEGACSWGRFRRNPEALLPEERRVVAFNASMQVVAGYSISFPEPDSRTFGMISLTGRDGLTQDDVDGIWDEHGREIEAMNNMVNLKIRSLPHVTARGVLSGRQLEVLEWVGQGKSNQDIAQILGVSVATVEKHLRLTRDRLGVETTAQALLKASFMNQIFRL